MNEDKIGDVFRAYMTAEMELLDDEFMNMEHEPYSKGFQKRFRRLTRAEKYFGGSLRMYNIARRAAAFAMIVLSLLTVNEVSAHVFGFSMWSFTSRYDRDNDMKDRYYGNRKSDSGVSEFKAVYDVPTYLPEGMVSTFNNSEDDGYVACDWKSKSGDITIQYTRIRIDKNTMISKDATYESKESVDIKGYPAMVYNKESGNSRIDWEDSEYSYMIEIYGMKNGKKTLVKIAESLYKEEE